MTDPNHAFHVILASGVALYASGGVFGIIRKLWRRHRYNSYMRSPEWTALALECKQRAGWRCQCGQPNCPVRPTRSNPLTAHHRTYTNLRGERIDELKALLKNCHWGTPDADLRNHPWKAKRYLG
jgi:hypothetical protein